MPRHLLLLLLVVLLVAAPLRCAGDYTMHQFEKDHMKEDHQVDEFTERSFFKMHDLDGDNHLDAFELEALYSFHGSGDEVTDSTKELVRHLLDTHDFNGDNRLDEDEYLKAKGAKPAEALGRLRNQRRSRFNPEMGAGRHGSANRGAPFVHPRDRTAQHAAKNVLGTGSQRSPGGARAAVAQEEAPVQPQHVEDKSNRIPNKYARRDM